MDENAGQSAEPTPPERDETPAEPVHVDRLEMTSPSLWTRGLTTSTILLVSAGLWFHEFIWAVLQAAQTPGQDVSWRIYVMVFGLPLLFVAYIVWRWWDKPAEPRAVTFHDDHVTLPVSSSSKRSVELAYEDIKGVLAMSRGANQSIMVDTGSQTLSYGEGDFVRDDALGRLRDELFRRVRQLPNADQVIAKMRQRQKLARIATSKPATVTKWLLGILAAYFGVELWMGVSTDTLGLLELGANAPFLIDQGQYFRLFSANFLHQGWIHIILNGVALLFLGGAVEKLVGPWRMLLIYLIGALAGSVGSYLAGPGMTSVGSSTAIFGLFGAFLVIHVRYWRQLPSPFRQSVDWWVFIIGLNAALPVLLPIIDYMAHLTGMIGGGLATWALLIPMKDLKPDHRPAKAVKIITAVVAAVFVAGLVQAAIYAVESHPTDEVQVYGNMLDQMLEAEDAPEQVNRVAWLTAVNPEATDGQLEQARRAVKQVVDEHDDRVEIRDTLATVNYRLAQKSTGTKRLELVDEAIAIEQKVLEETEPGPEFMGGGQATYASQLARFLNYRREIEGPVIRQDIFDGAPKLAFDPSGEGQLTVKAPAKAPQAVRVYAVARVEGNVEGLVRTCLSSGEQESVITDQPALERWPNNLRLLPGLVEPVDSCEEPLEFWPMTREIRELP
jgi:membrane associated rhomboid family serine protease